MLTFIGQALRDYHHTGAVMPSSRGLARRMTAAAARAGGAKRVLEVGPGTGSFTRRILSTLRPGDTLDVVEINPAFCTTLDERLLAPFRTAHPGVTIRLHNAAIEDAPLEGRFDFVICGLPFNNFPRPVVRSIFRRLTELLADDGEMIYFEYVGMKAIKRTFLGPAGRRGARRRGAEQAVLHRRHGAERELVMGNVPPAYAIRMRRGR